MQPSEYHIPIRDEYLAPQGEILSNPEVIMSQRQVDQIFVSIIEQEYGPKIAAELAKIGQDIAEARDYELGTTFFTKQDVL
jgi:hypothetical protein